MSHKPWTAFSRFKIDYTKHDWADIKFCDIGFQRLSFNTCRSSGWNFQLTSKYPFILIYQKLKYQIWTILGVPTSKCWFYELRPFDLITVHIHSDLVDDLLSFITDVVGEQVVTVPHQFEHLIMVLGPLCRVLQEEWRSILNIWFVYKYLQLLSWLKIHGISYYGIIQIPGDKFSRYHFLRLIWCNFIDLVSFIKNKNYF